LTSTAYTRDGLKAVAAAGAGSAGATTAATFRVMEAGGVSLPRAHETSAAASASAAPACPAVGRRVRRSLLAGRRFLCSIAGSP
jgi:hypothetical protein